MTTPEHETADAPVDPETTPSSAVADEDATTSEPAAAGADEAAAGEPGDAEATAESPEADTSDAAPAGSEPAATDVEADSTSARIAALVASLDREAALEAEAEAGGEAADEAASGGQLEAEAAEAAVISEPEAADEVVTGEQPAEATADALTATVEPLEAEPTDSEPADAPNATSGAQGEGEAAVAEGSGLPDLTEDEALYCALEALLLVVDSPAEVEMLADALDEPVKRIRAALKTMAAQYQEQNRGIDLRDVGGGWRFYTRDKYAPYVEKLLHDGHRAKLTRAALESLAVIAYRQPVTRARVAAVRGVNVDGVIRTLLVRGLIEETGTDRDTGGILYRTTELFLERLGLSSLEDLPPIAPLLPEVDAIDDV